MSELVNVNGNLVNPEFYNDLKELLEPTGTGIGAELVETFDVNKEYSPENIDSTILEKAKEEFSKNGESAKYRDYQAEIQKLKLEQEERRKERLTASPPNYTGEYHASTPEAQAEYLTDRLGKKSKDLAHNVELQIKNAERGFSNAGLKVAAEQDKKEIERITSQLKNIK